MEALILNLSGARFDEVLHHLGCPPECGDLELVFKEKATENGRTGVAITFTVDLHPKPGSGAERVQMRVQAVTTLRNLRAALASVAHITE